MRPAPAWLPEGIRLGVAPICWTNDVLPDLGGDIPLESCLAEAAAAGYQGIEFGRLFPRDARALRPLLDGYSLDLVSGWYSGFLADRKVEEEWRAAQRELFRVLGPRVHATLFRVFGTPQNAQCQSVDHFLETLH